MKCVYEKSIAKECQNFCQTTKLCIILQWMANRIHSKFFICLRLYSYISLRENNLFLMQFEFHIPTQIPFIKRAGYIF